jgi:hypothetical protein
VNEVLRERLRRRLEELPDERAYQVLDYIEFLESKYAARAAGAAPFQKAAETLEDALRAGRVPLDIIRGTMDAVGKTGRLLEGLAAAGRAAVEGVHAPGTPAGGAPPAAPGQGPVEEAKPAE